MVKQNFNLYSYSYEPKPRVKKKDSNLLSPYN